MRLSSNLRGKSPRISCCEVVMSVALVLVDPVHVRDSSAGSSKGLRTPAASSFVGVRARIARRCLYHRCILRVAAALAL